MFYSSIATALLAMTSLSQGVVAKDWESPAYTWLFSQPLPIPPVKQPKMRVTNPVTGKPIDYYEINILPLSKQIYPNKKPAALQGYDGIAPGPTFLIDKNIETVVRFTNNVTTDSAIHLHGSPSRAPWDGWAEDVIAPGQYKDYYYPNAQSGRFLWYHDHAMDHTAENANAGQAGGYILRDPNEDALGLPTGYGQFDIPLILNAKFYNSDGTLTSPAGETDSYFGDVIHVNGQPWPFFKVQPRKYRFRVLNASVSRSYILYLQRQSGSSSQIPFQVIGSDAGLLTKPITSSTLTISMAERWEIVVDFSSLAGQNVTLRNQEKVGKDDDYKETVNVMRFIVDSKAVTDNSRVPSTLRDVPFPPPATGKVDRRFEFARTGGEWRINGVVFSDVNNRVLAKVPKGTVETWELVNGGGGWTHPVHVHLVDFRVLSRSNGKRSVLPYEAAGLQDVVWLDAGETVRVQAFFAREGLYMFHCHNLIHEDHEMMAAFNVTALKDLGYDSFADPMAKEWRAVKADAADYTTAAIEAKVKKLAAQDPYKDVAGETKRSISAGSSLHERRLARNSG
ncbi:multicopper oxidase [Sarocladium strictum]